MDGGGSNSTPSHTESISKSSSGQTRHKSDLTWKYVTQGENASGKKILICDFCRNSFAGGGINRLKQHLAGIKGNVSACKKVPSDVRLLVQGSLQENAQKAKEKKGNFDIENPFGRSRDEYSGDDVQEIIPSKGKRAVIHEGVNKRKRKASRQRSLINFLIYCPDGITFIKSVDASDVETNAETLCNLFSEIVEIVGVDNVVHLVTDNASNYKAAGRLISEKYSSIYWSPCAAHCLNLIMKDIGDLPKIADVVTLASRVTKFIYNRKWVLSWLRKIPGWREILRPAETRFGTTFIALKSLHDHREHLEALVISSQFKKELKNDKAKEVKQIVLNEQFWTTCLVNVRIMGPVIRLLRICDSDERPSLGYVYDGMWRVINGIKTLFNYKEKLYKPYIDIVEKRWDTMLKKDLHAAAFWLNPAFQFEKDCRCNKPEIWKSVIEVMERFKIEGVQHVMDEITMFRTKSQSFGSNFAKNTCESSRPDEWWRLFGGDAPNLQKLAIRLLSQTASSSGCERNWSVFERIHTKKRNRLEHQRLNDLVYVHYNLRLKNRFIYKKRSYDPIDYESIDRTDFWVIEDQPEEELDLDELENIMEEEYPKDGGEGSSQPSKKSSTLVIDDDDDENDANIDLSNYDDGDSDEGGDGHGDGNGDGGGEGSRDRIRVLIGNEYDQELDD